MAAASLLAIVAGCWAVVASLWLFPVLSANSDEGIYLLQAESIAAGDLHPPQLDPEVSESFRPWFGVERNDHYLLKYTPVYAATLALSIWLFGTPLVALGLTAAAATASMVAFAREAGASRQAALVGGSLFLLSPLVLLLSGTYLPYLSNLVFLLLAALAVLRYCRTARSSDAWLAGLAWGLALFARPYDAVLAGLALVLFLGVSKRGQLRASAAGILWASLGAAAPVLAMLAFNFESTGSALQLPFNFIEPLDAPGFGPRRALPSDPILNYTPSLALEALVRNVVLVVAWTAGGLVSLVAAVAALIRGRLTGGLLFPVFCLVWLIGYGLFWGSYLTVSRWDGALFLGPYYFLPLVSLIIVAGAVGLTDLWQRSIWAGIGAALLALALTLVILLPALQENRERSVQRQTVADSLDEAVDTPAVVLVPPIYGPYLYNPLSFLRNAPEFDSEIVFALDTGNRTVSWVEDRYPARNLYRLSLPGGWTDQPGFRPDLEIVELG